MTSSRNKKQRRVKIDRADYNNPDMWFTAHEVAEVSDKKKTNVMGRVERCPLCGALKLDVRDVGCGELSLCMRDGCDYRKLRR